MIIKFFEVTKKITSKNKYFLLHGNNSGLIDDTIEKTLRPLLPKNVYNYEENEVINNQDNFKEEILNKSFFENEKLIIISRITEKIFNIIENIISNEIEDLSIILKSNALEKKSKIRNFFEKNSNTISIAFYEDNNQTLNMLAKNFLDKKKINISQQNLNFLINRCSGNRVNLKNELFKIESYAKDKKNISFEDIIKLTNLAENHNISELVDNCLVKNKKKTINILNENNFDNNDCVLISRVLLTKLKRLSIIKRELKNDNNMEKILSTHKPPIFWKDKDIVKQQIKVLNNEKIQNLIVETNKIELLIKKIPESSIKIMNNFILENVNN
jgi:DNA polymerase III subunit delta